MDINVTATKTDLYVYVLNGVGEVDLDLGNYERHLDVTLSRDNNITTGEIYQEVIEKEVCGIVFAISTFETRREPDGLLGKSYPTLPMLSKTKKFLVDNSCEGSDLGIVELGVTVGDIESTPSIEAMRQFQCHFGHGNFTLMHVSLVPDMHGEQKTKPIQTTVHALRGLGCFLIW
ncbi:P-loop containing nucleoside triphosphate hydrolase protein [Imleria badia]|nr:P-loop containing nucleoside triphosphate hydrolase protein [Imleria badia]